MSSLSFLKSMAKVLENRIEMRNKNLNILKPCNNKKV
jgi:hypothetical protein